MRNMQILNQKIILKNLKEIEFYALYFSIYL